MADMNTFQWKWNAATGDGASRLRQIKAANEARIAQLTQELEELQHTERMTDDDLLDLELASNRARAFDFVNSGSAFERIRNRRDERYRDAREMFKADQTKKMENDLKISELQKQYQQELNELANSADAHSDATHKTNLEYLAERIKQLGGTVPGGPVENYRTRSDIMNDYWDSTVNTETGRKFRDEVDDAKRNQLVDDLRSIGDFEKADALQATKTPAEIDAAKKAEKVRRNRLKLAVKQVNDQLKEARKLEASKDLQEQLKGDELRKEALALGDSLKRNFGSYVKFENDLATYIGKD